MTAARRPLWTVLVRLGLVLLLALAPLAVAVPAGTVGRAAAIDPGSGIPGFCPNRNGVTVVVDFQELGGTSIVRCAPGSQATGLAALQHAGFTITGVQRWGLAFICRIENKPGPDRESCVDTPPANAYWGYWYAPNGGAWKYSEWGVKNRTPPPGSFEGWSFSYHKTSKTNPGPRVAPTRPGQPVEAAPPPDRQSGGLRADPNDLGVTNGPAPATSPPPPPPSTSSRPAPPSSSTAVPPSSTAPAAPAKDAGVSANGVPYTGGQRLATQQDDGFPVTAVVGIGLVVLLVAAGGATAVLRRRAAKRAGG